MNRRKIRNAGKAFGTFCASFATLTVLVMLPMICGIDKINTIPCVIVIIAFFVYRYGVWRMNR